MGMDGQGWHIYPLVDQAWHPDKEEFGGPIRIKCIFGFFRDVGKGKFILRTVKPSFSRHAFNWT
jgi:hypothetical protein